MLSQLLVSSNDTVKDRSKSCPVYVLDKDQYVEFANGLSTTSRHSLTALDFKHGVGKTAFIPGKAGGLEAVLLCQGQGRDFDPMLAGKLSAALPQGYYHLAESCFANGDPEALELATLAFLLGSYRFTRYKADSTVQAKLVVSPGLDRERIAIIADSIAMARDLINTPTSDLGPDVFARLAIEMAGARDAKISEIVGEALLAENFPMIHAVGRAAKEEPRLVEFTWGDPAHPKVTLVGKSVCFDTGGLNLKPDNSMLLMKKDMGGGAIALAIARMIMDLRLPVRLRVILPIVENSVSAASFRPGDILQSRKGPSVEIGNTDAEGRLILADALTLAGEEEVELLFDFATLTGAARVALGPDLPAFFTDDERLATEVLVAGKQVNDPVWRLPLWNQYDTMLSSKIADLNHVSSGGFAGSITAALFLRRFVSEKTSWGHFDTYAWTPSTKPGRPEGGEAQVARLILRLLEKRFGEKQ